MEECSNLEMNTPFEKKRHSAQKAHINSPLYLKKTPKFSNTLKKNPESENILYQNNDAFNYEESPMRLVTKTKKKSKGSSRAKAKSIYIPKEKDEDFGFIKNKVEIINSHQKNKSKILDNTQNSEKENSCQRMFVKKITDSDEKFLLKEVTNTNKSNLKLTIPTRESILLENNQTNFFKNSMTMKKEAKPENYLQNKKLKENNFVLERDLRNIFEDLGINLKNYNGDGNNLLNDKSVLNNLNLLCIIQKNLKEIAQRKKEYLTDLVMRKSLTIDSEVEFQNYEQDSQNSLSQPPVDDYINKATDQEISYQSNKNSRSHSFCSSKRNSLINDKNFVNSKTKFRKKLKTIDFDDEKSFQIEKKTEVLENSNEYQSTNSTAELLKLMNIKNNFEQSSYISKKISCSFLFTGKDEILYDCDENHNVKEENFLREFVINYPMSKKRTFNKNNHHHH